MTTTDRIQTILIAITIIGLLITITHNRKQLKIFNDQLKLIFFADYTKRYQKIMLHFPLNINEPDFDYSTLGEDARNKILRYLW